jgi:hypothetical protein
VQPSDSRRTTTPYDLLVCGFTATNSAGSFVAVPGNFGGGKYLMP